MKKKTVLLLLVLVAAAASLSFQGPVIKTGPQGGVVADLSQIYTSEWGHVVWFETGWADDTMAVMLDVQTVDPHCKVTDAGYALNPKDPGVKVHEAAIMGAYFSGKRVRIRAKGCAYDKPQVIAVGVTE